MVRHCWWSVVIQRIFNRSPSFYAPSSAPRLAPARGAGPGRHSHPGSLLEESVHLRHYLSRRLLGRHGAGPHRREAGADNFVHLVVPGDEGQRVGVLAGIENALDLGGGERGDDLGLGQRRKRGKESGILPPEGSPLRASHVLEEAPGPIW